MGTRRRAREEQGLNKAGLSAAKRMCLSLPPPPATTDSGDEGDAGEDSKTSLLDLPEHLILKILGYLPPSDLAGGVRRTCTSLHELSKNPYLWTRLDITFEKEAAPVVTRAKCRFYSGLLRQQCRQYRFRLKRGSEIDGGLRDLGRGACVKKDLASVVVSLHEKDVPRETKMRLSITRGLRYPNLQHLKLQCGSSPRADFVSRHPMLRSLSIVCQCRPTSGCHPQNCNHNMVQLFEHLAICQHKHMDAFSLILDNNTFNNSRHTSQGLSQAMMRYFLTGPTLTHLTLSLPVSEEVMQTILTRCTQLQTLCLNNMKFTLRAFVPLLNNPNMFVTCLKLDCPLDDPSMVYAISMCFPALRELTVVLSVGARDIWVAHAMRFLTVPDFFPNLTDLNVTIHHVTILNPPAVIQGGSDEPLPTVSRPEIPEIPKTMGVLSHVRIAMNVFGFWFGLKYLLEYQPELKDLKLIMTPRTLTSLKDKDVDNLAKLCPKLEELNLSKCTMTGPQLLQLRTMPRLHTLYCGLSSESLAQSASVQSMALPASKLRHLFVTRWPDMTCQSVKSLSQLCPDLQTLRISNMDIAPKQFSTIIRVFPELEDVGIIPSLFDPSLSLYDPISTDQCLDILLKDMPPKLSKVDLLRTLPPTSPELLAKVLVHSPALRSLRVSAYLDRYTGHLTTSPSTDHVSKQSVWAAIDQELTRPGQQRPGLKVKEDMSLYSVDYPCQCIGFFVE